MADAEQIIVSAPEKLLFKTRQKRIAKKIHPRTLIITDRQIAIFSPEWFGYSVDSYGYGIIQDIHVEKKIRQSSLMMKTTLGEITINGLPRTAGDKAVGAIRSKL
jgi:hypothetical protein